MDIFDQPKNMKILLIDDDEWIRDSLSLFFEGEGCHLLALETAEEALEALNNQTYEIIITDYRLPGIDGLEFLRQIQSKNLEAMKILITAYGDDEAYNSAFKRAGIGRVDTIEELFDCAESKLKMIPHSELEFVFIQFFCEFGEIIAV
jgi:DNA-binding NtrC family response regulator